MACAYSIPRKWGPVSASQNPLLPMLPMSYTSAGARRRSLPAGRRVVRQADADGLDFMDLAAPDLEDVHGRHVEGLLIGHVRLRAVRTARDLEDLLGHGVVEVREADRKAGHRVGNLHAAIFDRGDVLEGAGVD